MTTAVVPGDLYRTLQVDPRARQEVIRAAYHALARVFHPDQVMTGDTRLMADVNCAYAVLRDPTQRTEYDRVRSLPPPVARSANATDANAVPPPPRPDGTKASGTVLTQGRYAGWTLEQLAKQDSDYLRWLRRHTSGLRYRSRIDQLLSQAAFATQHR